MNRFRRDRRAREASLITHSSSLAILTRHSLAHRIIAVPMAVKFDQQILIHTPHLEDKYQGTRMILDMLCDDSRIDHSRVLVDHVEEHTVKLVLDTGMWAGMTLYPESKCTPARAIDILECYGSERIWMNSACDWGISDPLAVPKTALEMRRRGHSDDFVDAVLYRNPHRFLAHRIDLFGEFLRALLHEKGY